jgi:hypothetical protein
MKHESHGFGEWLSPLTFSAQTSLPPVSYYAFFKGGCFQAHLLVVITRPLPCTLCHPLGTLTNDLGCFPLDLGSSHPKSVYPSWAGIRSFKGIKDVGPLSKKCSTPVLKSSCLKLLSGISFGRATQIAFAENQLSLGLLSLSLLTTSLPDILLHVRVLSSIPS